MMDYQLIRWRFRPSDPILAISIEYRYLWHNTSPYLVIRMALQIAEEGNQTLSLASAALKNDNYVDDLVSDASSMETVLQLRNQLIAGCHENGLRITSWC